MEFQISIDQQDTGYIARAFDPNSGFEFISYAHTDPDLARDEAASWIKWFEQFSSGNCDCIYYILAVPETWPGPPPGSHSYSGLMVKIGRSNDVLRRFKELRTGTFADLIIHALEPGDASVEAERHRQFSSERRQGEWFSVSPELMKHIFDTWQHSKVLPREHQYKVMRLCERVPILRSTRAVFQKSPDMINPSLNEPWSGSVFIDTTVMTERQLRGE
jgi:hypothetical protein